MTTYLTRGRKYHQDPACHLMNGGEDLHWTDERESGIYRRQTESPATAAAYGKYPCLYCVPAFERVLPEADDHGHEPVSLMRDGFGTHPPVCVRCNVVRRSYLEAVAWPCTSATVLGLS